MAQMLGRVSVALKSGFVFCELLCASPPLIRIRLANGECTALVRHALLASLWNGRAVVVTSSVHLVMEGTEMLVVLGVREVTPSDTPAALCLTQCLVAPRIALTDATIRKSTPIAELCARRGTRPDLTCSVVFKSLPIPFKNGMGEMIAFDFRDESGKIRAVSFSPECHELDARLRIGGRYRVTGGRCKKADVRFNETSHEFEMVLDASACVEEFDS